MDDREESADEATATGISAAWPEFEKKLGEVLGALDEDQYLVISGKRNPLYVQFSARGSFGFRVESVSNNYLSEADVLNDDQIAALHKLGWSCPTGTPQEATSQRQPDGSPNFFADFGRSVPFEDVARMAVRTLTEVHGCPHPRFLDYEAFDADRREILIPTLGLKRRLPAPAREETLEAAPDPPDRIPIVFKKDATAEEIYATIRARMKKRGMKPSGDVN